MDLSERQLQILQAIITDYVENAEPVGSRSIAKKYDLGVSPATIRNEMSDLEEMGYIIQPHTSAGRIPTDKGYRFYVDSMMAEKNESVQEHGVLLERVDKLESLLKQVAKVLAYNTQYATLVSSPQMRNRQVKFIQLSQVDDEDLVAVIVVGDNVAKNQLIHVNRPLSNEEVLKLNLLLNTFLTGASVNEINGTSNILRYGELGDVNKASALLETLEDKNGLESLLDQTINQDEDGDGIQIYIGEESPVQNMKDYSIVTSTYALPEGAKGTIGIIGPKRMDYKKVVQTLKNLTDELDTIFRKNEKKG